MNIAALHRDDPSLSFLPLEEAFTPTNGSRPMVGYWWSVCPERGLIFYRKYSPQANVEEKVARVLNGQLYPWAKIAYIRAVFVPRHHIARDDW